jgi:drug/metabolite transporter (DMT)-like permease
VSEHRRALAQIHVCVVLWGFTAILGKLITLPALGLVVWRMLLVVGALLLVPMVWRGLRGMRPREWAIFAGIGALVALHWLTFYGSIKLANASIAVTCIALTPIFLALLEPAITGKRFDPRELALGIVALPGVALVVGGVPSGMHLGIAVGTLSALLVALFGALNKRHIGTHPALAVTAIELGAGAATLIAIGMCTTAMGPVLPTLDQRNALLMAVLAYGCTLLPFALSLVALRRLSAYQAQLAINLEPVYAILLAIPLLGEQRELSLQFYIGVGLILAAVFLEPWIRRN